MNEAESIDLVPSTESAPASGAPVAEANGAQKRGGKLLPVGLTLLAVMAVGGGWLWYSGRNIESGELKHWQQIVLRQLAGAQA